MISNIRDCLALITESLKVKENDDDRKDGGNNDEKRLETKRILVVGFQVFCSCPFQRLAFFKPWPMREANSVITILGFTFTKSSGSA